MCNLYSNWYESGLKVCLYRKLTHFGNCGSPWLCFMAWYAEVWFMHIGAAKDASEGAICQPKYDSWCRWSEKARNYHFFDFYISRLDKTSIRESPVIRQKNVKTDNSLNFLPQLGVTNFDVCANYEAGPDTSRISRNCFPKITFYRSFPLLKIYPKVT